MLLLYFAGREVEALLGPKHFLAIYFGGGLAGSLMQWAMQPLDAPLVGASACVLAALIAFTTILPELEITCLLFFVIPVRLKAKYLAQAVMAISLFFILIPYSWCFLSEKRRQPDHIKTLHQPFLYRGALRPPRRLHVRLALREAARLRQPVAHPEILSGKNGGRRTAANT